MDENEAAREHPTNLSTTQKASRRPPGPSRSYDPDNDTTLLLVSTLLPADSPRLDGENEEHIRLLAESDDELPPILVHRRTMQVIDGMHRLHAARLRGQREIRARLFDGSLDEAFVAAVEANIEHGLPLSFADREAAARRIVAIYPQWSDRAIAGVTGISARTVGAVRRRMSAGPQQASRVGRDGRVRPLSSAEGRRRAGELFARHPGASLREVARGAGISVGTAWDVRARVRRGEDPVPSPGTAGRGRSAVAAARRRMGRAAREHRDRATILRDLRRDPAIRFTDSGRGLLRWLDAHAVGADGWEQVTDAIPAHCGYVVANLAYAIADEWLDLADRLRSQASVEGDGRVGRGSP